MSREHPAYRDNLASVLEFLRNKYHDERHFLCIGDVREYLGRSYNFVRDNFGVDRMGISAESFARKLST